jgi:hypothetical protein
LAAPAILPLRRHGSPLLVGELSGEGVAEREVISTAMS